MTAVGKVWGEGSSPKLKGDWIALEHGRVYDGTRMCMRIISVKDKVAARDVLGTAK